MNETNLANRNGGGCRPDRSTLDRATLLQHFDDDMDLLCEIAETFLEYSPTLIAEIASAATARSPERLRAAAHSLKGSAANFGAQDVVAAASLLESMGITAHLDGVDAAGADLLVCMETLRAGLTDLVNLR